MIDIDTVYEKYAKAFVEFGIDNPIKREKLKMAAQIVHELTGLEIKSVLGNILIMAVAGSCRCGSDSCCKADDASCECE